MGNRKWKKLLCHGLAFAMAVTTMASGVTTKESPAKVAKAAEQSEAKVLYRNGFEDGELMGITGRGPVTLEVSNSEHYGTGNNSLLCTGRSSTWNGVTLTIDSYVKAGETYEFYAYVKQNTGKDENLGLKLQYNDKNGETKYVNVKEGEPEEGVVCKSGEWVQLGGVHTIPEYEGEMSLYVECFTSDSADFLVDDLTIIGKPVAGDSGEESKDFNPNTEVYRSMVEGGVFSTGNNARIKAAIQKARDGKDVSLAYIGGSITEGGGYNPNSACYAEVSANLFKDKFGVDGGKNVHFINAGMSGTPSDIGVVRYERDVLKRLPQGSDHPDILFVEFAVNDSGCETKGGAYEGLIRRALKSGSAVVLIFSVFNNLNRVEEMNYRKYGTHYDLPMVSTADAIKDVYKENGFYDWFYNDTLHPNANGYKLMADCIQELMDRIDKEEAEEDNVKDVDAIQAVTSSSYEGIKMIDSATTADSDVAISSIKAGGFSSVDTGVPTFQYMYNGKAGAKWFPANWMHAKDGSSEPLTIDVNCQTLMLVYKETSEKAYGSADLYVDGVKKKTLKCYNSSGWNNGKVCIAIKEETSATHRIELKMAEGDEAKKFTLYAIGYQTDGKEASEDISIATPTPTVEPTATPEPSGQPIAEPSNVPTTEPTATPVPTQKPTVTKVTAPGKAKISSAKAKGKTATVKWAKVKGAAGYQVQYVVGKTTKKVTTKKTTITIKSVKKGKKYSVKVRAYKLNGKKKVYGSWSSKKSFKA